MPKPRSERRERLLQAPAELTHRRGFCGRSLATLSRAARIPLGNVYYYRSMQEIAAAIVDNRAAHFRRHRAAWDAVARDATKLLAEPLGWFEAQFRATGKEKESASLANTFDEPDLVLVETRRLER